ncbi:MAG TPA: ADP-polyphosphate phosphotransferase [Opitutaceae bacterium]|jgi:PPK2 family polyphosphate:nucleotide phosphotransferase
MRIDPEDFRARPGERVHLRRWPTRTDPCYKSDKDYRGHLVKDVRKLSALQQMLYAESTYSLLLVFQAMDAAGKDGAIAHVLSGVNPEGCDVHSFKEPSKEELAHDFLWRTNCRLPARGRIGVFNRSYYEEVLVVRVHPSLLGGEGLPRGIARDKDIWKHRYHSIREMERHLERNGTRIVKLFLHLSKGEQRRRFLARIEEPEKNWKFSLDDMRERSFWGRYERAYEACIEETGTGEAPWYIVPADDKLNARLIVSRIVIRELEGLPLRFPKVDHARRRELKAIRARLER